MEISLERVRPTLTLDLYVIVVLRSIEYRHVNLLFIVYCIPLQRKNVDKDIALSVIFLGKRKE